MRSLGENIENIQWNSLLTWNIYRIQNLPPLGSRDIGNFFLYWLNETQLFFNFILKYIYIYIFFLFFSFILFSTKKIWKILFFIYSFQLGLTDSKWMPKCLPVLVEWHISQCVSPPRQKWLTHPYFSGEMRSNTVNQQEINRGRHQSPVHKLIDKLSLRRPIWQWACI